MNVYKNAIIKSIMAIKVVKFHFILWPSDKIKWNKNVIVLTDEDSALFAMNIPRWLENLLMTINMFFVV
jgi:enterochelin esterase-like enzyme